VTAIETILVYECIQIAKREIDREGEKVEVETMSENGREVVKVTYEDYRLPLGHSRTVPSLPDH
jgi:hypothetical protein